MYFRIAVKVGSLTLFITGSKFLYLLISRFCTIFLKNVLNISAASESVFETSIFSRKLIRLWHMLYLNVKHFLPSKTPHCQILLSCLSLHNNWFQFFLKLSIFIVVSYFLYNTLVCISFVFETVVSMFQSFCNSFEMIFGKKGYLAALLV